MKDTTAKNLMGLASAGMLAAILLAGFGCATVTKLLPGGESVDWQNPFGGDSNSGTETESGNLLSSLPIDQLSALAESKYPGSGAVIAGIFGSSKPADQPDLIDGFPYTTQMSGTMKDNETFDGEQFTRDDINSLTKIDTPIAPAPRVTQVDPSALWSGPVVVTPPSTNGAPPATTNGVPPVGADIPDKFDGLLTEAERLAAEESEATAGQ